MGNFHNPGANVNVCKARFNWYSFLCIVGGFNYNNMKRVLFFMTLGLFAFMVIGADNRESQISAVSLKRACKGYTVIEASKGVDCNGDTIKLVKVSGFYQRAR